MEMVNSAVITGDSRYTRGFAFLWIAVQIKNSKHGERLLKATFDVKLAPGFFDAGRISSLRIPW